MENAFSPGDVVQLCSGGPLLTAVSTMNGSTSIIYYNDITGLYEHFVTDQRCLRIATTKPEAPSDAAAMRQSSVTKSSMSS